jgi:hypothetical protein
VIQSLSFLSSSSGFREIYSKVQQLSFSVALAKEIGTAHSLTITWLLLDAFLIEAPIFAKNSANPHIKSLKYID